MESLLDAVVRRDTKQVQRLLSSEELPSCTSSWRRLLQSVLQEGCLPVLQLIMRRIPASTLYDQEYTEGNIVHVLAVHGHTHLLSYLREVTDPEIFFNLINYRNTEGETPLHRTCHNGRVDMVEYLCDTKMVSVSTSDFSGRTPLHCSVEHCHLSVCETLIKYGASVDKRQIPFRIFDDSHGRTPLMLAADKGYLKIIKLLIKNKACPRKTNIRSLNALGFACKSGNLDCVKYLLPHTMKNINLALCVAASSGHSNIVQYLLKNVKFSDRGLGKVLSIAASDINSFNMLEMLCDCSSHSVDNLNQALYGAVKHRNIKGVTFLVRHGADCNCKTGPSGSPLLQKAVEKDDVPMIKLLISSGADLNATNEKGITPFMTSCLQKQMNALELFQDIFETGRPYLDINTVDQFGYNVLFYAVGSDLTRAVEWLLLQGSDVNQVTESGFSPLHMACKCGASRDTVMVLLKYGADVNRLSSIHQTPLMLAITNKQCEIITILVDYGAKNETIFETRPLENLYLVNCLKLGLFKSAYLLIATGWQFTHKLLEDVLDQKMLSNNEAEHMSEVQEWFYVHKNNPLSLQELCRRSIRGHIKKPVSIQSRLLPLPDRICRFIRME